MGNGSRVSQLKLSSSDFITVFISTYAKLKISISIGIGVSVSVRQARVRYKVLTNLYFSCILERMDLFNAFFYPWIVDSLYF